MMNIERWLEGPAVRLEGYWRRHRVTILLTLVVNLALVAVLLVVGISTKHQYVESEVSLALFEEVPEVLEVPPPVQEEVRNHQWSHEMTPTDVRNIAVDRGAEDPLNAGIRDDKGIDADELYREAARVRAEMRANQSAFAPEPEEGTAEVPNTDQKNITPPANPYRGPSVVSYSLPGRKAYSLPVPAYKCENGGMVVVEIVVSAAGKVNRAVVDPAHSAADPCLHAEAIRAAMRARFTPSPNRQPKQLGSITYMFVPQ